MKYRPEIDGLRAVAVIPVILFHSGYQGISGGFVGVDIFFVISGFLITSLLLKDVTDGSFSVLQFYARRARRILPALFFVIMCTIPLSYLWLSPQDLKSYFRSVFATSTFVSNILFWQETGYFATAAESKPLIHTWSLAVEEQYYIVIPFVVMFFFRRGLKHLAVAFLLILVSSLVLSQWASVNYPSFSYFFILTRSWELVVGGLVAIFLRSSRMNKFAVANGALTLLGLSMIGLSLFLIDEGTVFPGFWALLPVLGTALVVLGGGTPSIGNAFLSSPPLVFVGQLSYSAYLWHQPLFAYAKYRTLGAPPASLMVGLTFATFAFAYISWRFVERPFRHDGVFGALSVSRVIAISASALGVLAIVGVVGSVSDGYPRRHPLLVGKDIDLGWKDAGWVENAASSKFVLVGDSHARHYFLALREKLGSLTMLAQPSCLSIGDFVSSRKDIKYGLNTRACLEVSDNLAEILSEGETTHLFLSYYWMKDVYDRRTAKEMGNLEDADLLREFLSGVIGWVHEISPNTTVVLIAPTPGAIVAGRDMELGYVRCLFVAGGSCPVSYSKRIREGQAVTMAIYDGAQEIQQVIVIDPSSGLCDDWRCYIVKDGALLFSDVGHLTLEGARLALSEFQADKLKEWPR